MSGRQCESGELRPPHEGGEAARRARTASAVSAPTVSAVTPPATDRACRARSPTAKGLAGPSIRESPDPNGICRSAGAASCGQTGLCDGFGGCARFARDTPCTVADLLREQAQHARNVQRPRRLQRARASRTAIRSVAPVARARPAARRTTIATTASRASTARVVRSAKVSCAARGASACSNFCVDGVCCENACAGGCWSCAMASSPGKCMPVVAGNPDPRAVCQVQAQSTCGTNGKCDGSGGCQKYRSTPSAPTETCVSNVYTPASMCNASGQCVAPDALPCAPFSCNASKCFTQCTANTQCVSPNTCVKNSCGLKDNGASCSATDRVQERVLRAGRLLRPGVHGGVQVLRRRRARRLLEHRHRHGRSAGALRGSGRCQLRHQRPLPGRRVPALRRADAVPRRELPDDDGPVHGAVDVQRRRGVRDAGGVQLLPVPVRHERVQGVVHRSTRTASRPRPASTARVASSRRARRASAPQECLGGFCEQGVCCRTSCTGVCSSCALTASRGTCTNKAPGDTDTRCADMGPASCGTDGLCDGNGACHRYDASTSCAAPTCPANQSTLVTGRTCDGRGTCLPASNIACAPYVCNGSTACRAACTDDTDCLSPSICDQADQPLRQQVQRLGQACTDDRAVLDRQLPASTASAAARTSCGLCQACNVGTSAGNCAPVPMGTANRRGRCAAAPPCGNTGACNGAGACLQAAPACRAERRRARARRTRRSRTARAAARARPRPRPAAHRTRAAARRAARAARRTATAWRRSRARGRRPAGAAR